MRSLDLLGRFASEMGVNVWFRRGGYLLLAPDDRHIPRLQENIEVQRPSGMRTRIISRTEACEIVPQLDLGRVRAASRNADDGVLFPWPFLWGYAGRPGAQAATVRTFTEVTGFDSAGARIRAVETTAGRVACDTVVNAAGAWSPGLASLAGVALPDRPTRHEILVTEPLKSWLDPLVSLLGTGLCLSQSRRGDIVGGMGDPGELAGLHPGSTLRFLACFSRILTGLAPLTRPLRVMRQWAGSCEVTPDNNPILGAAGPGNFLRPTMNRFARPGAPREEFIIG